MQRALAFVLIAALLIFDIALCFVLWANFEHGKPPMMIKYSGRCIPITVSANRMEDGFYVIALSWRWKTIAFEKGGVHLYGG